jgi:hypothetical protein
MLYSTSIFEPELSKAVLFTLIFRTAGIGAKTILQYSWKSATGTEYDIGSEIDSMLRIDIFWLS